MIFTDLIFVVFFGIVFAGHWLLRSDQGRKYWLLLASYVFYAAWDVRFLSLIIGSTAVDFIAAQRMQSDKDEPTRKRWLVISLITNLGMLATFKYFNFFLDSAIDLADVLGWHGYERSFELILPVGISFFTFQTLSYTIDVHRRQIEPVSNPFDFALFVAFFPQLVAGPIVRAKDFLPQLSNRRKWSEVNVRIALTLFLLGYMKKACISDNLNPLIDPVFANPEIFDWLALCGATLGYSVQIYCDFSGYSDMAIATAALLGYSLCENFRFPYFSNGVREFWRRWHISLSTWLRDYLYVPLGGNRCGPKRNAINLMITMTLGGLWHGAAWSFLLWGALHGLALVFSRVWSRRRTSTPEPMPGALSSQIAPANCISVSARCFATFVFVSLLWIVFRVPQLDRAWLIIWSLLTFSSPGEYGMGEYLWWFLAVFVACHTIAWRHQSSLNNSAVDGDGLIGRCSIDSFTSRLSDPLFWLLLGAGVALALSFANRQVKPFIYFQF